MLMILSPESCSVPRTDDGLDAAVVGITHSFCLQMLEKYRADVEYIDPNRLGHSAMASLWICAPQWGSVCPGQQRDILRKDKLNLGKRIHEALRMAEARGFEDIRTSTEWDGFTISPPKILQAGEANPALLYVAEMR